MTATTVTTPWIAFYTDRFIKEASLLNPIETAIYYRFIEAYLQNGHLPDDPYLLQEIVRLDSALSVFRLLMPEGANLDRNAWERIKEGSINRVLNRFFHLDGDGAWHHDGWDREISKASKKYTASVKRINDMREKQARGIVAADVEEEDEDAESLAG